MSGLDSGSSSSEDEDSGFVDTLGSDEDKKGAAKGGADAEKGVKRARSKARAAKKAKT